MTGTDFIDKSRDKWNRIYRKSSENEPRPSSVLTDYRYLVPSQGRALDIACGLGGNTLYLASSGLMTTAIDLSDEGIDKLKQKATAKNLEVNAIVADVSNAYFASHEQYHQAFDVISVSNYLDRQLFTIFPDLLRPGGLLFYQTFVQDKSDVENGPSNPAFLLEANELLALTQPLVCRVFYDLGTVGDTGHGLRNQSCIIAQKGG